MAATAFEGGDHDDGQVGVDGFDGFQQFQPIHARHAHVGDNEVEIGLADHLQGLFAVAGGEDLQSFLAEKFGEYDQVIGFVIDDEHGVHGQPFSGMLFFS